jgi:hypothetical protein
MANRAKRFPGLSMQRRSEKNRRGKFRGDMFWVKNTFYISLSFLCQSRFAGCYVSNRNPEFWPNSHPAGRLAGHEQALEKCSSQSWRPIPSEDQSQLPPGPLPIGRNQPRWMAQLNEPGERNVPG